MRLFKSNAHKAQLAENYDHHMMMIYLEGLNKGPGLRFTDGTNIATRLRSLFWVVQPILYNDYSILPGDEHII